MLSVTELFELKTLVNGFGDFPRWKTTLPWDFPADLRIDGLEPVERLFDPEKTGTGTFYIYDAYLEALGAIRPRRSGGMKENPTGKSNRETLEKALV